MNVSKTLIAILLFSSKVLLTQGVYPLHTNRYVNDFANVLNDTSKDLITRAIKEVETKTGAELTVVTINSVKDYKDNSSIESFSTELFNTWGVGKKDKNNGAMLLVALNDRNVRIELGKGFPAHYNKVMKNIIDSTIVPSFKYKHYNDGIYNGTLAIAKAITQQKSWFDYELNPFIQLLLWILIFGLPLHLFFLWRGKKKKKSFRKSNRNGWFGPWFHGGGGGSSGGGFGGGSSSGGGSSGSW